MIDGLKILSSSLLTFMLLAACHEEPERDQIRSNTAENPAIDISPDLVQRFDQMDLDPEHHEAVIVTLAPGTDTQKLESVGMRIEHKMKNRPIVSGTLNSVAFKKLMSMPGVERIEPDGEMKALDP